MINFNLFIQTGYSFNGSLIDIEKLVLKSKELGYLTLGIGDVNNLYGAVKFYQLCKKSGIKPLIGMQIYLKNNELVQTPFLLYAKNQQGYLNLIKISTYLGTIDKVIPLEELQKYQHGLIIISMTSQGDIYQALLSNDLGKANDLVRNYEKIFDDYFLGLDLNNFTIEMKIAPELKNLGKMIVINQVNYLEKEDRYAATILKSILKEQHQIQDGLFVNEESIFDLKSLDVLTQMYQDYSKAIQNTYDLIDSIDFNFDFTKRHLPKFLVPNNHEAHHYLKALAENGLKRRLQTKKSTKYGFITYQERLNYELNVIHQMNYDDYFLIVWDFVLYAKKNHILVGPGRGSAAGSLVSYVLGIVDVDPLEFDLYFERFLNPERITMPDIDMDFPDDKRDEVIRYVVNKYGKDHVTSIITFGTFQGKSALRDTARILNISDTIVSEVTTYVGESDNSIFEFIKDQPQKYSYLMEIPEVNQLFQVATKLVGLPRHISTHAAGIIITDQEITNYVPVQNGLMDMYQTQFEASDLEELGLLKIDFLGLRNLTTIDKVLDLIFKESGEVLDIYKIPMDDQLTFQLLKNVNTLGIFQLESKGMMSLLRQMQIENFEDISTCIALFRPGPMENIPTFLKRRLHQEEVHYPHPDLESILKSTQGIIVYQEQIMKIANSFAGYSLGEADVLRRAVSKKKESILIEERDKFIRKSKEKNQSEVISNEIYDYIVKFANYGFNKSHSVVYSLIAYWMAYLKANYPTYFMAVLLDASIGSQTATADYIRDCRKLGIKVYPPRINESEKRYKLENNHLRFPYLGIRNIGTIIGARLEEMKEVRPFNSFIDFMSRAKDINIRVIESMILIGMFDEFPQTKKTLIENIKQISGFLSLGLVAKEEDFVYIEFLEYDYEYLQKQEKELIGINLSYHAINQYIDLLEKEQIPLVSDIIDQTIGHIEFAGVIRKIKPIKTKKGDLMAFLWIEDQFSEIEGVLFPEDYEQCKKDLIINDALLIQGTLDMRNKGKQVIIKQIKKIGR
ncbi:MAG: DNA polymerase III subunit alpha [Firmicutes bacterium]|nr:DNA polymerase III subunit alpha [Bacillota bacterium]